jgi:hemerythrin-like domain-containing protein
VTDHLPPVLEPLTELRHQLMTTLSLLEEQAEEGEMDAVVRADLASEIVGFGAQYEDVKDRTVYPVLRGVPALARQVGEAEERQKEVRATLSEIRRRTQHVKPDYVFADDPGGTEQAIESMVDALRHHLDYENEEIFPMVSELDGERAQQLHDDIRDALSTSTTHPEPPRSHLGRAVVALREKLERDVKDESTPVHPGVERLQDELAHDHRTGARH